MLYYFLLYSKVNQLYVYIYPLLSRVPCAIQQVLMSYLFYIVVYICQTQSPNLSHHHTVY